MLMSEVEKGGTKAFERQGRSLFFYTRPVPRDYRNGANTHTKERVEAKEGIRLEGRTHTRQMRMSNWPITACACTITTVTTKK